MHTQTVTIKHCKCGTKIYGKSVHCTDCYKKKKLADDLVRKASRRPVKHCLDCKTVITGKNMRCEKCKRKRMLDGKRMEYLRNTAKDGELIIGKEKPCAVCGTVFVVSSPNRRTCSPACRDEAIRRNQLAVSSKHNKVLHQSTDTETRESRLIDEVVVMAWMRGNNDERRIIESNPQNRHLMPKFEEGKSMPDCTMPGCVRKDCGYTNPPLCERHADLVRVVMMTVKDGSKQLSISEIQVRARIKLGYTPRSDLVQYLIGEQAWA